MSESEKGTPDDVPRIMPRRHAHPLAILAVLLGVGLVWVAVAYMCLESSETVTIRHMVHIRHAFQMYCWKYQKLPTGMDELLGHSGTLSHEQSLDGYGKPIELILSPGGEVLLRARDKSGQRWRTARFRALPMEDATWVAPWIKEPDQVEPDWDQSSEAGGK